MKTRRRLGVLGHAADPERRSPDRVQPLRPGLSRGRGLHRHAPERRAHRERGQQRRLQHRRPDAERDDRPAPSRCRWATARNAQWAKIDNLFMQQRRRAGCRSCTSSSPRSSPPGCTAWCSPARYFELIPRCGSPSDPRRTHRRLPLDPGGAPVGRGVRRRRAGPPVRHAALRRLGGPAAPQRPPDRGGVRGRLARRADGAPAVAQGQPVARAAGGPELRGPRRRHLRAGRAARRADRGHQPRS